MVHPAASEFLSSNKQNIINKWETLVRKEVPEAEGKTSAVIVNSLAILINELVAELGRDQPSPELISESAMSRIHGAERAELSGYNIPQLLKEFSLLREILIDELHTHTLLTYEVHRLIDKAIDFVISKASEQFVLVQNEAVKNALRIAEQSNRDLELFAAITAHDLKSPLATISEYLTIIKTEKESLTKEEYLKYVDIMERTSERLLSLIDSLLNYARISMQHKPFKNVNTNELVSDVLQNLSQLISIEKATFKVAHLPLIKGDNVLLMQVFQNLVVNGIKFHGTKQPEIVISCEEKAHSWVFSVSDNGIGFDPQKKEEIFSLYKKLSETKAGAGFGIGLATCRKVVESHGGTIWAESTPGIGSTFYFEIPKEPIIEVYKNLKSA
ncbi:MAG: sensor histidine kinase [Pseudobdellovibrionaceae bacterium]